MVGNMGWLLSKDPMLRKRPVAGAVAGRLGRLCGMAVAIIPSHSTFWLKIGNAFNMFNHMVEQSSAVLDRVFGALSDPTRRAMLRQLAAGARTVGELAEPFDMSFAAAAKHVKVLEQAGLLSRTIEGRSHRCRLAAGPLAAADRWLAYYERFWSMRLDDLERALRKGNRK
jgi:DNA-binding transcriptional ArsR family regulator